MLQNGIYRGQLRKEILLTSQHVDKSPHEEKKAAECIGDLKPFED